MAITFAAGTESIRTAGVFNELAVGSVSVWFNPSSVSGANRLLGTDTLWECRLNGSDMLHEFRQSAQPNMTTVFAISTWYHVVFVWDGTVKGAYVNAVADPAPATLAHGANGNDTVLSVGTSTWNAGQGMSGQLEDLRMYNRVLSLSEVEAIFNSGGRDGIVNGLQHWWELRGPSGAVVSNEQDRVGTVNLSTIVGSPTYSESIRRSFRSGY